MFLNFIVYSLFIPFVLSGGHQGHAHSQKQNLIVETRTGTFIGNLNDTYPDVRQFKYIPYAKPPIGSQRWTPPEILDDSSAVHDSTVFGPSCSQYVSAINTAWALNISGNLIVNYGESLHAGLVAQNSAEDCLSLAIWTPADAKAGARLPVTIFITGGGFVTGGINIPAQLPTNWVHRSQKHIVVSINYRLNIFGFPNARGLNGSTNFGLQDQRMAVEWVAENIAAFGGDPTKITLWGQSAGAISADMYLFAYPDDPIVRGTVSTSGVAIGNAPNQDYSGSNFTFVARAMGCDFEDPAVELDCMRRIPMPRLVNYFGQYQDNSTLVNKSQPAISFNRQADNRSVFSDYPSRYAKGQLAKIPKIIGTTSREAAPQVPYPINNITAGPWEPGVVSSTLRTVCAAYNTSVYRSEAHDLPTYRYQWAGNFTNLSPLPWLGAYHFSDLYMLMGTYLIAPGVITGLERQTSEAMQDYLLDFVMDPMGMTKSGWPEYDTMQDGGGKLARFGADGKAVQIVDGDSVDGACHLPGYTYDTSP